MFSLLSALLLLVVGLGAEPDSRAVPGFDLAE